MAKVGSLNLIKQFSSAQGEDKQVCFPHRATPNSIVLFIARISLFGAFHCSLFLQQWVFISTKALRAQFKNAWIDHFDKKKRK